MSKRNLVIALSAAAAVVIPISSAHSELNVTVCAKRTEYVEYLRSSRNETQEEVALVSEDSLAELFISPVGTWTILTTTPQGLSCVVGSGEGLAKRASM